MEEFKDLFAKFSIVDAKPFNQGWSNDKKYIIVDENNRKLLLRVSDISVYEKRKEQYLLYKRIDDLNINCPSLVDFGLLHENKVYMIFTWLEGIPLANYLASTSSDEAYRLGKEAGLMLRRIHAIDVGPLDITWKAKYQSKIERKKNAFINCKLDLPLKDKVLNHYLDHTYLMDNRPLVLCHGDYHVGNMIFNEGKISIIDFDKMALADPYDELKVFCWSVFESPAFENGLINAYFDNKIPNDFFEILKFYISEVLISHLPWAEDFGGEEVKVGLKVYDSVLKWYDNFERDIPSWYKKEE